jgi:hypothetical protein
MVTTISSRAPISLLLRIASQGVRVWGCGARSFHPFSSTPLDQSAMSTESPLCSQNSEAKETLAASTVTSAPGARAAEADSVAAEGKTHESGEKVVADGTRMSKIKVALVLGYNGSRFNGLQRNPGQLTIEDVLEEAVCAHHVLTAGILLFFAQIQSWRHRRQQLPRFSQDQLDKGGQDRQRRSRHW